MIEQELILLTGVSLVLAIAIGANDETFAPVTGAKLLSVNKAVFIGAGIIIIGAVTYGYKIAVEVGTGLTGGSVNIPQILTILFSVAFLLVLGSWKGLPLSTTHTMVGSTVALAIILGDSASIDMTKIGRIVLSWFISPVLGYVGSYYIMKLVMRIKKTYIKGLDDVDRLEILFSRGLIVAVIVTAFSRGANDVSNAVAPLMASYIQLASDPDMGLIDRVPLFLAGICMGIGLILIGRRVLKTLGNDVVELSPTTAVSVQVSTAVITFVAASVQIPISGTHVLVAAFVGTGMASGTKVNMNSVKRIAVSAIATPFAAALATMVMWYAIINPIYR
ncbi:MAG: inorganic phosphate transporter [Candidatus Heimdallarchaeota archaeon]|nr:inorganic phosphate transporter [Candidatus Heimdallarchaeota archaeon]